MSNSKIKRRLKIKRRVAGSIQVSADRPRLVVFRSNSEIYAQIVDVNHKTICASSSLEKDINGMKENNVAKAAIVGKRIADKAKGMGIEKVVFDRNGFLYHGRIKSLAEAAREAGLQF
ncbi:MAG: 50S ribosomal protein L18 [Bacteroidetes bacterium]|nr:50S ribosomal protein L18 [Bacteroidota bacterium]